MHLAAPSYTDLGFVCEGDVLGDGLGRLVMLDRLVVMQALPRALSLHPGETVIEVRGGHSRLAGHHGRLFQLATIAATSIAEHRVQELGGRPSPTEKSN